MQHFSKIIASFMLCFLLLNFSIPNMTYATEQTDFKLLDVVSSDENSRFYWEFKDKVNDLTGGAYSMTVGGQKYANGFKLGDPANVVYKLDAKYTKLSGFIGLDDAYNSHATSVQFLSNDRVIAIIELDAKNPLKPFEIDLTGVDYLSIVKGSGYSEIDFVDPMLSTSPNPTAVEPTVNADPYLTDIMFSFTNKQYWTFNKASYSKLGEGNSMTMAGKAYLNGIKLGKSGSVTYDLFKKYGTIYCTVGLDDFKNSKDTTITFTSERGVEKTLTLKAKSKPQVIQLNIKDLKTLRIERDSADTEVNFAELRLSTQVLVPREVPVVKPEPPKVKPYSVIINKKVAAMTLAPIERNGVVYLPLAETAIKLGFKRAETSKDFSTFVTIIQGNGKSSLWFYHNQFSEYEYHTGLAGASPLVTDQLASKLIVENNVIYLPTNEISRLLGSSVKIDKTKRSITLGKAKL